MNQTANDSADNEKADEVLQALLTKFAAATCCWMSSVRPDGRAHLAPIWHVWHANAAFVCTPTSAVRAQNVAVNPSVSLALPDPLAVLIIEGVATAAPELRTELQPLFYAKYAWDIATDHEYNLLLRIVPRKILAWGEHGEGRWRF